MSVAVYFPLYKVSTSYIVRQGRVWTPLEHMLLRRVSKRASASLDLARDAAVPINLVIEALIELLSAGWVQIRSGTEGVLFEATPSGKRAAESDSLPMDWQTQKRRTNLCMERVTASFIKPEDLSIVHRDKVPSGAQVISPRLFKLAMSPVSCLDRLYMLDDEAFEEWVDYRVTSQNLFAVASVVGEEVQGLPGYVPSDLLQAIKEEAALSDRGKGKVATTTPFIRAGSSDRDARGEIGPDDLVVGGSDHLEVVQSVLARAKKLVVVHSCFVHPNAIRKLMPSLEAAAKRGVDVELLWGQRTNELAEWSQRAFAEARKIFASMTPALRSRIRFAESETGSHAKIIIADSGSNGTYECYVGSCNWLSAGYRDIEISVRLREPRLVAQVAALLGSLRMPTSGRWSADVYRLVSIQSACRAGRADAGSGPCELSVVIDQEHLAAVREARDNAKARIVAGCDLYGPAGETSVFVPMRTAAQSDAKVSLYFNRLATSVSEGARDTAVEALRSNGIVLEKRSHLHGKFLIWDNDTMVISSFNWLATTPDPWKPVGAEVGVVIRGSGISQILERKLQKALEDVELRDSNVAAVPASG
jgi:phosphatidylserine/phosphatidylglycerophosphate/cardiolipin synthase-like enzyme